MESKIILAKLIAKKASLVAPSVTDFWGAARNDVFIAWGGDPAIPFRDVLMGSQLQAAYSERTKQHKCAIVDHCEIESALDFAIEHYKGQIKLELALSLIEEEDQVTEETPPVQFMVFQFGYCVLGFGSELAEAIEDANQWSSEKIKYGDVECYDSTQSHVDGKIYWTTQELVITAYKLNQQ